MRRDNAGFSLVEILAVVAAFSIVAAAAVPKLVEAAGGMTLGQGLGEVRQELEMARLRAAAADRPVRVRFNCPSAGHYRTVEVIGRPGSPDEADSPLSRCSDVAYPYPAADRDPTTRPNDDGPLRRLDASLSFGAVPALEFWPDGSVHQQAGVGDAWPEVDAAGTAITVKKGSMVKTITVNRLGKIRLQP